MPTGGFKIAVKPFIDTTGPPIHVEEIGKAPLEVFRVKVVLGTAEQYDVFPDKPVIITGFAI